MSLTVWFDIGNTRGKFWLTDGDCVLARAAVVHGGGLGDLLAGLPALFNARPASVCGASVLDEEQNRLLVLACRQKWGREPVFAASQASSGQVVSAYDQEPTRLGVDRWLGLLALGARPGKSCIVSCGTAITVDVTEAGKHIGGYIVPGLMMMHGALRAGSAKVRWSELQAGSLQPGVSTAEAVEHGVLLMASALVEQVVRRESPSWLVLTGGDAPRVSAFVERHHIVEPELILRGLRVYFRDH